MLGDDRGGRRLVPPQSIFGHAIRDRLHLVRSEALELRRVREDADKKMSRAETSFCRLDAGERERRTYISQVELQLHRLRGCSAQGSASTAPRTSRRRSWRRSSSPAPKSSPLSRARAPAARRSSYTSPRRQSAGARRSRDEWFKKCSRRDSDLSSTQECPLLGQVLKQLFGRSAHALTNFCANAGIVLRHFQN